LGFIEQRVGALRRAADRQHELAFLIGAALRLLDQQLVVRGRKQFQIGQAGIGQPLADVLQALGDDRQPDPGSKQFAELARRGEIAEAVAALARIDQAERGELLDDVRRQPAERRQLRRRVGARLLVRDRAAGPFEKTPLARDHDAVRLGPREAVRRPAVAEQRPAEFADHQQARALGDAAARRAAVPAHVLERLGPLHRREPAGEGDGSFERCAFLLRAHRS
jgi:hypothetical protein